MVMEGGLFKMAILDRVINFGKGIKTGYKIGEQIMQEAGDTTVHSIFNPAFGQKLSTGTASTPPITAKENPAAFLGAYSARLVTDLGTDQSRRYYWKYNHPLAIADQVLKNAVGEEMHAAMTPTQRGLLGLATITPVAASMGIYDITNVGELGRPKGYAQQYAAVGSEDRRETEQPLQESFERFFLQRQGQPLKYETARQDIPDLTPKRYGDYLNYLYQDKGLLNLGVLKGTTQNLEGVPEARLLGFPITIPSAAATAGAAAGLTLAGRTPGITPRRTILAGLAGSVGGAAIGNVVNEVIAMANRPKLPDLHDYQERYSAIPVDPNQQNIG